MVGLNTQKKAGGMMTVLQMVEKQLKEVGADGLYNSDGCGCPLDCLAPCGNLNENCEAAKKIKCEPKDECCCDVKFEEGADCFVPIEGSGNE